MVQEDELVIGANFLNHDSAIFAIDVYNRRLFGMSTERITRYKHDKIFPIPVIEELIREFGLDRSAIRRVTVATSALSQLGIQVQCDPYTATASLREALNVRYLNDVVRELERYSHLSNLSKLRLLMASPSGRKYLVREMLGDGKVTTFQSMV